MFIHLIDVNHLKLNNGNSITIDSPWNSFWSWHFYPHHWKVNYLIWRAIDLQLVCLSCEYLMGACVYCIRYQLRFNVILIRKFTRDIYSKNILISRRVRTWSSKMKTSIRFLHIHMPSKQMIDKHGKKITDIKGIQSCVITRKLFRKKNMYSIRWLASFITKREEKIIFFAELAEWWQEPFLVYQLSLLT